MVWCGAASTSASSVPRPPAETQPTYNMKGSMLVMTEAEAQQLYRCKDINCPFVEVPKHGSVSWQSRGPDWIELRFWQKPPNQTGWMLVEEFQRQKAEIKQNHIDFFRKHPDDLRRKIDLKRRGARLLRSQEFQRPYASAL